jgi:hypothetical protein
MGQDPGCLAVMKRRVHLRARRDTGALVAVEAEALGVVAGLAIRRVREDVHRMSLHEVAAVEPPGFLRGVTVSADLLGVALRAVHAAAGSQRTVPRLEVGWMHGSGNARWVDAESRSHAWPGKREDGGA